MNLSYLYDDLTSCLFNEFGDYRGQHLANHFFADTDMDHKVITDQDVIYVTYPRDQAQKS